MSSSLTLNQVQSYCAQRLPGLLPDATLTSLSETMAALCDPNARLPYRDGRIVYSELSLLSGIAVKQLRPAHGALLPLLAAMARARARPSNARRRRSAPSPKSTAVQSPSTERIVLPPRFDLALARLLALHGDSAWRVAWALKEKGLKISGATLKAWAAGQTRPGRRHWSHLRAIAIRYGMAEDELIQRWSPAPPVEARVFATVPKSLRKDLAWHLPADFAERPAEEQAEIIAWIVRTFGAGSTDYRLYLQACGKQPYALRLGATSEMPPHLQAEIDALIEFKTTAFVPIGWLRAGVWNDETAAQKRTQLAQLFGALAEMGIKAHALTLGLLAMPQVWDRWLRWRETRRGFYIAGEADLLRLAQALTRPATGWLRQSPQLASRLRVIKGLVTRDQIAEARGNWNAACDRELAYARSRVRDIQRVARVHRDPFEPIVTVLKAEEPVAHYRRICDDIEQSMPDPDAFPTEAAEAVRSLLMLRLGLHLGLRQRNLRELLLCPKGRRPTTEAKLMALRRGELRCCDAGKVWEVLIPTAAFKNGYSSFFDGQSYHVVLPDIGGLYGLIRAWIGRHRPVLIGSAVDSGTVFVATARGPNSRLALGKAAFYDLWRQTIARYGVFNPYTGRGAIPGLLPHGPHAVRDVLATHVLKATGSYEHAGYAIQDTAETVARHYGRFLPRDKSALAAQIINQVWEG